MMSLKALGSLMIACAEHTGLAHCGMVVGAAVGLCDIDALGPIIREKETLGSALRELVGDLGKDAGAVVALDERGDVAVLRFLPYDPEVEGVAALGEAFLAALTRIAREICGPDWRPAEVLLARRPPVDCQPYRNFFRAPVRFDEETAALVIPARALSMPCPRWRGTSGTRNGLRERCRLGTRSRGHGAATTSDRALAREPRMYGGRAAFLGSQTHFEPSLEGERNALQDDRRRGPVRGRAPAGQRHRHPARTALGRPAFF